MPPSYAFYWIFQCGQSFHSKQAVTTHTQQSKVMSELLEDKRTKQSLYFLQQIPLCFPYQLLIIIFHAISQLVHLTYTCSVHFNFNIFTILDGNQYYISLLMGHFISNQFPSYLLSTANNIARRKNEFSFDFIISKFCLASRIM